MPDSNYPTSKQIHSNLPDYNAPYQQRYQQYNNTIQFNVQPITDSADVAPTYEQNRLSIFEYVDIYLDNNQPLVLDRLGITLTGRVLSVSKKRIEIDCSATFKAHDITMRLHVNNSKQPNKARFCEYIVSVVDVSSSGHYIHAQIMKTHNERPWLRAYDTIPNTAFKVDEKLSLLHNPWRKLPFSDRAGNQIMGLVTVRDAQTIHLALINQGRVENNVNCAEIRFDRFTYGRMFGMSVHMLSHNISHSIYNDDDITVNLDVMNTDKYITKFIFDNVFELPFDKFAILDTNNDQMVQQHSNNTWSTKPLRLDIMDITNDHTVVLKISRTEWNNSTADSSGDWRVATVQLDLPKHVYLDSDSELEISLLAIHHYTNDIDTANKYIPSIKINVTDPKLKNNVVSNHIVNNVQANSNSVDESKFRKTGQYAKETANTDMELKNYIQSALSDL